MDTDCRAGGRYLHRANRSHNSSHNAASGSYSFQLAASDSQLTTVQTFTVQVLANQPPTVSISPFNPSTTLPLNVVLTATATDDGLPSGQLTFTWVQNSGPVPVLFSNPTSTIAPVAANTTVPAKTQVSFTMAGTYGLQVT